MQVHEVYQCCDAFMGSPLRMRPSLVRRIGWWIGPQPASDQHVRAVRASPATSGEMERCAREDEATERHVQLGASYTTYGLSMQISTRLVLFRRWRASALRATGVRLVFPWFTALSELPDMGTQFRFHSTMHDSWNSGLGLQIRFRKRPYPGRRLFPRGLERSKFSRGNINCINGPPNSNVVRGHHYSACPSM